MEERNISKCCNLQFQTQYTQQVIVNGVPQNSGEVEVPILTCPNCSHVIAQFNPGTTMLQVFEVCENEISKQINYCVKCGQKLDFPLLIEAEAQEA